MPLPGLVPNSRFPKAFTLVELLVVTCIVAILAAMLFPAFNSARLSGMLAKCVNNQHQVTTAYLDYLGDNNETLWYQGSSAGPWSGGSGALFGPQNYTNAPGYFCYMLQPYGLKLAAWNSYAAISNRMQTAWYCPTTSGQTSITGHGATYYYQFIGSYIGRTNGVRLPAVAAYISVKPYLWDYYGNHANPSQLYSATNKNVYSYLDGHSSVQ